MASKHSFKTEDRALGGKMKCPGCGGEWWISGAQLKQAEKDGGLPKKCGNSKQFRAPGTREDCVYEGELDFIPYDIDEQEAIFKEKGEPAGDTLREMAAMLIQKEKDKEKGGNG